MTFKIRQPDEKLKQISGEVQSTAGYLRRQKWTAPDAAAADYVHANITLTTDIQQIATGITNPDFPRIVTIKGTKAGATLTGNVVITGTNIRDEVITDTIALNGDTEVAGVKAFKTITNIQVPVRVTAADVVSIGASDALGLDRCMQGNEVVLATIDGAYEATRPTVTYHATDISKNTVNPHTALDADVDMGVVYVTVEKTSKKQTTA